MVEIRKGRVSNVRTNNDAVVDFGGSSSEQSFEGGRFDGRLRDEGLFSGDGGGGSGRRRWRGSGRIEGLDG